MNNWIDFNMLMMELTHHRNNAARIINAYKGITNPTDWDKLECKEAVGKVVALECIMAWCKDFKFSSKEVMHIINKESNNDTGGNKRSN